MRCALLLSAALVLLGACRPQPARAPAPEQPAPESAQAAPLAPAAVWLEAEHFDEPPPADREAPQESAGTAGFSGEILNLQRDADGLEMIDYALGEGPQARAGAQLTIHYTGTLLDGTVFDSTHERDRPFEFELGAKRVIEGFERGLDGVRVGMRRKLVIPPELAYGDQARGDIPAAATLVFEIEVLEVK